MDTTLEFIPRQYEDPYRGQRLPGYAQLLVARANGRRFWIRVIVAATHLDGAPLQRRQDIRDLCHHIDFASIPLISDTVTEIFITTSGTTTSTSTLPLRSSGLPPDHHYSSLLADLRFEAREDPSRVRYPEYIGEADTKKLQLSDIDVRDRVGGAVYRATPTCGQPCVFKQVDRRLYLPQDSEALESELRVLEKLGGRANIVRLVAVVVSDNPYLTDPDDTASPVLHGILLEHHPNGTLDKAMANTGQYWKRWALQLIEAVDMLHCHGFTHMDLKPSNAVIDQNNNLVLIDVGGAGGVTREWLSPHMTKSPSALQESFDARRDNDIWAVGKLLATMAKFEVGEEASHFLREVSSRVREESPDISLSDITTILVSHPS